MSTCKQFGVLPRHFKWYQILKLLPRENYFWENSAWVRMILPFLTCISTDMCQTKYLLRKLMAHHGLCRFFFKLVSSLSHVIILFHSALQNIFFSVICICICYSRGAGIAGVCLREATWLCTVRYLHHVFYHKDYPSITHVFLVSCGSLSWSF